MGFPDPRPDLGLRKGYHSPQVDVAVRLNTNESPYPPPEAWWTDLTAELVDLDAHRYPDRSARRLREGLADLHGVEPGQVFCANGSNEVIQCLCLAYGGPGRSVAVFEPTYALHAHIAHLTGTAVGEGERRADFALDLAEVDRILDRDRPALTFLCSPNNPTGAAETAGSVAAVVTRAPGLVVVDEAYGQFADWSALDLVAESTPLVVTRTFSKTWSMAALRLGYCVAPEAVVADLERVALPYHLDALKQAAGRLALRYRAEMEERVGVVVAERERLAKALATLPVEVWPSSANFILFRPLGVDGDTVWQRLVDHSVLVRNCSSWPRLGGCLRVTVGTPDEGDRFLVALHEALGTVVR